MANIRDHHPEAILEVTSITITTWTSLKQLNTSSGWILGPEYHEMSVNINQKNDLWLNITKMFSSKFSKSRKSRCCTMLREGLRAGIIRSQTPLGLRWNVHHFRRPKKKLGKSGSPKLRHWWNVWRNCRWFRSLINWTPVLMNSAMKHVWPKFQVSAGQNQVGLAAGWIRSGSICFATSFFSRSPRFEGPSVPSLKLIVLRCWGETLTLWTASFSAIVSVTKSSSAQRGKQK